jgi:hypothetical protein
MLDKPELTGEETTARRHAGRQREGRGVGLRRALVSVAAAVAIVSVVPSAAGALSVPQSAHTVAKYANCAAMNRVYKHGVGKPGAHDHVSGRTKPVTTFYKNLALYNANKARDRDNDGIACEKA